jgi:VWFA-related protein
VVEERSFRVFRSYLSYLRLLCLATGAFARQHGGIGSLPPPPSTGTPDNHITLDVVVNDKQGKPVSGLTQQAFTVLDNKQPQKILSFEARDQRTEANSGVEVVVVIDAVNTAFGRVAYERDQVQKFLLQDGGKLAWPVSLDIFTDSGLKIQPTSSRDGNSLVAYLNQNETGLRSIRRTQGYYGAVDRTALSLQALGQLAEYEAKRPGRKLVIWISPGWPLLSGPNTQLTSKQEQDIFHTIVAMSAALRQARMTLYSVDPLGTADAAGFRTFYYEQFLKGVKTPNQVMIGNLALQVFAVQSGGRVLNSSNDVTGEIERSARDADAYYVLSYDAPPADGPDEYHAIEVKLSQPQLKAQTRSGYYDQPVRPRTP